MKILYLTTLCYLLIFLCVFKTQLITTALSDDIPEVNFIRDYIQNIQEFKSIKFGGESVSAIDVLPVFYENREYRPAWSTDKVRDLLTQIKDTYKDGLNPQDYHLNLITELLQELDSGIQINPSQNALFDIFLTDSFLRLSYHLRYGKVDPEALDPNWNLPKVLSEIKEQATLEDVLESGTVETYIENLKPSHFYYKRMKNALASYRDIKINGGWKNIDAGPSLKPGMSGGRVAELRERLIITADLDDTIPYDPKYFDNSLENGVKEFQKRHGLAVDGIAGAQTIKAMNIPVEDRINQIRVNLERARWVLHDLPPKFLIVNIAGFTAFYVKNGDPVWTSKVVVGKTYRKTPVFRADIRYIVFNPTWTVPPTILRKDILPAVKEDPSYLRDKNIKVLDKNGIEISQSTINWSDYTWKNFPYILRQDPGPENALGLIKFIFPNKHFVFLHDTPSKSLFEKDVRTFSSGCIRIENPLELAGLLLHGQDGWNNESITDAIDQKVTRTVVLQYPIPILILYWTSRVNDNGKIEFLPDVYQRDAAILHDLDAKFD